MKQKEIILKRQELYELVWSTPLTTLAKSYNLSDNGLRKICKKMNIPTPYSGYWAILQHGKKAKATPLPAPDSKTILEYTVDPEKEKTPLKILADLPKIKVNEDLKNPHPLIKIALQYIKNNKSVDSKLVIPLGFSEELEIRGLMLLNTIFYELEKHKCTIIYKEGSYYDRYPAATLEGETVHFHLYEQSKAHKIENPQFMSPRYEYTYLGLLQFKIEGYFWENVRMTYSEGAKRKIEDFLPSIINSVMIALGHKRAWTLLQEEKRSEEKRMKTLRENEEKKKAEEKRKWGLLYRMAVQLNSFDSVQRLILQIRRNYKNEISENIKLNEWLDWAETENNKNNPIESLGFLSKFESK